MHKIIAWSTSIFTIACLCFVIPVMIALSTNKTDGYLIVAAFIVGATQRKIAEHANKIAKKYYDKS